MSAVAAMSPGWFDGTNRITVANKCVGHTAVKKGVISERKIFLKRQKPKHADQT